jgi:hypothetical protein
MGIGGRPGGRVWELLLRSDRRPGHRDEHEHHVVRRIFRGDGQFVRKPHLRRGQRRVFHRDSVEWCNRHGGEWHRTVCCNGQCRDLRRHGDAACYLFFVRCRRVNWYEPIPQLNDRSDVWFEQLRDE